MKGVSVVVPVHNGETLIANTVASILPEIAGRPAELILVDDCSADGSSTVLSELASHPCVRVIPGPGRGAAAAINAGVRAARYPLVAQVDQDVVLQPGWVANLLDDLDDPSVGAAQGYYLPAPDARLFGRVMNLDLEQRYAGIDGSDTDHVCTGNVIYRADALHRVGLFDEGLGYGYDNDISYRLGEAGYRLRINRSARAVHRWREGLLEYARQQYGFGYGRIDLVAKHPGRIGGDAVSPTPMMMHPLGMLVVLLSITLALVSVATGAEARPWWALAAGFFALLFLERAVAGFVARRRFGDAAALAFPFAHLVRDLAWVAAIVVWSWRRLVGQPKRPSDSMTPRSA